jgi:hypothetical protein
MRRPQLSTGAWLFCGIVAAALIAPAGVYAAVNSRVAIGNVNNPSTAFVTGQRQLLSTMVAPRNIVRFERDVSGQGCSTLYTPPSGKALLLTNVTFFTGTGSAGGEKFTILTNKGCSHDYDAFETAAAWETQQHTYPAGLPVDSLSVNHSNYTALYVTGYLIPASALPPNVP